MRKVLSYLWLPITAGLVVILIYGSLTVADLKNKNQALEQKQSKLETKISEFENNLGGDQNIQVAGIKDEQPKTKTVTLNAEPSFTPEPTPVFTLAATTRPTSTPRPSSTSISTPTPTPTLSPTPVNQASLIIDNVGSYSINLQANDTAFSILLRAGDQNGFSVDYQTYEGMGAFVSCIAGICAHDSYYWAFYYNGSYSMVGASAQTISAGDNTTWKFESF